MVAKHRLKGFKYKAFIARYLLMFYLEQLKVSYRYIHRYRLPSFIH